MKIAVDVERMPAEVSEGELIEALTGRSQRFRRVEALKELRLREFPGKTEVLGTAVLDRAAPVELRAAAAVALGEEATPENQDFLASALADESPDVIRRAAQGLGRIGDRRALEELESVKRPLPPPAQRAVSFAKALISYRLSLGQDRLVPDAGETLKVSRAVPVTIKLADPELPQRIERQLRRELPAIPVSIESALQVTCAGEELLLLPTRQLHGTTDPEQFRRRNLVVAAVLKRYSAGFWELYEYVLAHPSLEGVELIGVKPTGVITHSGQARVEAGRAEFRLETVNTIGNVPIEVSGSYLLSENRIDFTRAVANAGFAPEQKRPRTPQKANVEWPRPARR